MKKIAALCLLLFFSLTVGYSQQWITNRFYGFIIEVPTNWTASDALEDIVLGMLSPDKHCAIYIQTLTILEDFRMRDYLEELLIEVGIQSPIMSPISKDDCARMGIQEGAVASFYTPDKTIGMIALMKAKDLIFSLSIEYPVGTGDVYSPEVKRIVKSFRFY